MLRKKKDSIDNQYNSQIKYFQQMESNHPNIKKEYESKRQQLDLLMKKDMLELTNSEMELQAKLKLELPRLLKELEQIETRDSVNKYFLELGGTLSQYYQTLNDKNRDLPSFEELIKGQSQVENTMRQISQKFNAHIDPLNNYQHTINEIEYICNTCQVKKQINQSEGLLICPNCMDSEHLVIHADKPCYNDSPCDNIYFSYKRINHFKEKLNKVQQKYNFKLSRITEDKLCEMFLKIQEPFIKFCPADKNNFTSYSYVINKCLHILNQPENAKYFHLLKSKDKLYQTDTIWKKICQELKWPYHPSSC